MEVTNIVGNSGFLIMPINVVLLIASIVRKGRRNCVGENGVVYQNNAI